MGSSGLADQAIKACDADGDGFVDKDEFFQIVGKLSVLAKASGGKKARMRGVETPAAKAFNDAQPLTDEELDEIDNAEELDELEEDLEDDDEEESAPKKKGCSIQ